jgi:diguanylate cyclase (GGDEF)-like protein
MERKLLPIFADLAVLDRYYDAWRIVDPTQKTIWTGSRHGQEFPKEKCFHMWFKDEPCPNCIATRALKEKQIFRKMEYAGGQLYFLKAVPIQIHEETYVIELIQNITDSSMLERVVNTAPSIEEMAQTIERLSQDVIRDELTGVYNKRYILEKLPAEILSVHLENSVLSVGIADIDHFKRINDQYGHVIGDEVLKAFAETLATNVRTTDWVARYGGEEFLFILRGADCEKAHRVTEKLRKLIEKLMIRTESGTIQITASFGVYTLDRSDSNIDDIITRADHNLYKAKSLGRNQVVCS